MAKSKSKTSPMKYLEQVRQDARNVVWPTARETMVTTMLVMVMMVLFGIFFFIVDWAAANSVTQLLKIGTQSGGSGLGG